MIAATFLAFQTEAYTPPIAQILGIQVGADSSASLEKDLGKGYPRDAPWPSASEVWVTRNPLARIETAGFDHDPENHTLCERLIWSVGFTPTSEDAKRSKQYVNVPRTKGWLGNILLGDSSAHVKNVLSKNFLLRRKFISGDSFRFLEDGQVTINGHHYTHWKATVRFDERYKVKKIEVVAWYDLKDKLDDPGLFDKSTHFVAPPEFQIPSF